MKYLINLCVLLLLVFLFGCARNKTSVQTVRIIPLNKQNAQSKGFKPSESVQSSRIPVQSQEVAWQNLSEPSKDLSKPLRAVRGLIVIDPGHGGEDQGTKTIGKPLYLEKSFNLITAKFLASYLEQMGYQILLTRTNDIFVPLKERAQFANERRSQLFVSVHYNSAPSQDAQGIEVFYYKSAENALRTESSKKLASTILNELLKTTSATSRGVKAGNFAVIRETHMPAVLIEGGFLTNAEELDKLKDPNYLKKVAWGIAQGIHQGFLAGYF